MNEEMFRLAMQRPGNYHRLSERSQWEIDKNLGILDWDGEMTQEQRSQYEQRFSVKLGKK